ncbi:MAG: hypothetical protein OXR73_33220 [Myxococcales bacterium]|nr:hypothetical protein [Myxococcales bacterium]
MAQLVGIHRAPITWQRDLTTTILRVEIRRRGEAILWEADFTGGDSYGEDMTMILHECPAELVVPVDIQVSTTDGHLDFCEPTGLTLSHDGASLSVRLPFATHRGSLEVLAFHPKGIEVKNFVVRLGFTRKRTMVGRISGFYVSGHYAHFDEYACFPDPPPPELRPADNLRGCDR